MIFFIEIGLDIGIIFGTEFKTNLKVLSGSPKIPPGDRKGTQKGIPKEDQKSVYIFKENLRI